MLDMHTPTTTARAAIWESDLIDLQKKLEQLQPGRGPQDPRHLIEELLAATLPGFERDLKETQKNLTEAPPALPTPALPPISQAIMAGMQKYTDIRTRLAAVYVLERTLQWTHAVAPRASR